MAPKLLLFTGAPAPSFLTASSCTLTTFTPPFTALFNIPQPPTEPAPERPQAAWRSIPLTRQPLNTSFNRAHHLASTSFQGPLDDHFFTTASVSFEDGTTSFLSDDGDAAQQDLVTQFCEHSLALHNPIPSSQLDSFLDTSITDTSFLTTSSTDQPTTTTTASPLLPSHLSDLEDVPSARQIQALNPQTVTLNLIVGIISIAQPRTVTTRWGKTLSLVEILVGDETRSGFAVTFWLENAMEGPVSALRRQDVVLLQNVALHVFRGMVHGQSLRRGLTKANLLWRCDGSGHYSTRQLAKSGNAHPQLQKAKQVKDWVLKFVGRDPDDNSKPALDVWDKLPDDTQFPTT